MRWKEYLIGKAHRQIILLLLLPAVCFAQRRATPTDSVKDILVKLYNVGNEDAIYALCDTSFQHSASRSYVVQFLKKMRRSAGTITATKKTDSSGRVTVYFADFKRNEMDLLLAVNRLGKITTLIFRPAKKDYTVPGGNPLKNRVDSLVEKAIRPYIQRSNSVGVAIGIIYKGKIYKYGYGETKKDNRRVPDGDAIFEIGSVTKTFTATLLAMLTLEGKCNLDDPVNKYLPPDLPPLHKKGVAVTLKMLANHTSGLPRVPSNLSTIQSFAPGDPYKNYDTAALFRYLDTVRLRSVPGQRFQYSNLGFGLLGVVLERISGLSFEKLLEKYICDPLGMDNTRTMLNDMQRTHFCEGYKTNGTPALHWHFESMAGGGAIRSTVNDMLKYLKAYLFADTVTMQGKAMVLCEQQTFDGPMRKIGLAWNSPYYAPHMFWKNGGTRGFCSYCAFNPDKRVAVVVLSNTALPVDGAGMMLMRVLSGKGE